MSFLLVHLSVLGLGVLRMVETLRIVKPNELQRQN
jgi:hypothetical protein